MSAIEDLEDLPLSHLFSGPLVAAIDASIQAQTEKVDLLQNAGFDENGELVRVSFGYTTTEIDPETGEERTVAKELRIPLLMFLSLPNLVVSEIEEQFTAKIKQVEKPEQSSSPTRLATPLRLNVAPASQSSTFRGKTQSSFDLDIRMVASLENESSGMETLERAVSGAMFENVDEKRTKKLEERRRETEE
ncbi:DUF2589 domain-containing protein [Haloplanus sp. GCM10025708]|uniref:DUF2589 domain-containing protein n=1 Tax=Haloferacaceae TaxID=1644056 RepID=UPI00361EAA91